MADDAPVRPLRVGDRGLNVLGWQRFLVGQDLLSPVSADLIFGPGTEAATLRFQEQQGLSQDGEVGKNTLKAAAALGFQPLSAAFWPPAPDFRPLTSKQRKDLFGTFAYVAGPTAADPEAIRITDGWDQENIVWVDIPQLKGKRGARRGRMQFHRKAARQLAALFAAWEQAGLISRVLVFNGSYVPRFQRDSTTLSSHSWGSSFDLNAAYNPFLEPPARLGTEGCLLELVQIANEHGFFWGGHFSSRIDGQHFEVARLKG
ncbi:MAG TPA: M15 family metallopeptidase [Myxococcales bacterium]|nr:M15 family metallopeptidase [Myxococcales bacterium]